VFGKRLEIAMASRPAVNDALAAFLAGDYTSLRAAARAFGVPESTVRDRAHGSKTRAEARTSQQLLSVEQEEMLVRWILDLDMYGQAPNFAQLRAMAGLISAVSNGPSTVGKAYIQRFLKRHPEVKSKLGRKIGNKRSREVTEEAVRGWYESLLKILTGRLIQKDHIFNMDETGTALEDCGN